MIIRILAIISCLLLGSNALAEQDHNYSLGYSPSVILQHVTSNKGDSEALSNISLLRVKINKLLSKKNRMSLSVESFDESFNATPERLGQKAKGLITNIQYQRKINLSRTMKFWVGAGISLQNIELTDRAFIDEDGFINDESRFDDVKETQTAVVFSVNKTNFLSENIELNIEYLLASTGLNGLSVGINWYPESLSF